MGDAEVLKKLRDIPFRIQTSSIKERRIVIEEIQDVLSSPGITEPAVRFICRVLTLTLHRYRDTTSQSYVKALLAYLTKNHREWTLKNFLPVVLEISEVLKNTVTSKNLSQSGLYALRWTTVLVENGLKGEPVDYNIIVLSQANLLTTVIAYGDKKKIGKAYSMLHNAWKTIGIEEVSNWVEVLLSQAPDSGPHVCITFSALCRHYKDVNNQEIILQHKAKMLESFIKSLISVKSRPNPNHIRGCSHLLHLLDKSDIKSTLLPALHKAMLRSPETIIEAVGEVVDNLNVHLDELTVDIGKSLIVNTHSRDEWTRAASMSALSRVAHRCSTLAAAELLLKATFAEYDGASGKLTSSEDKIAVINAAGTLSEVNVPAQEFGVLIAKIAAHMSAILDAESHERTLCAVLHALYRWGSRAPAHLPDEILNIYKKNLSAKSTSQAVRISYASLISRLVVERGTTAQQMEVLCPSLRAAVEKALKQPLQHAVVSEGVCAMLSLVATAQGRELCDGDKALWNTLVHPDKHVLLHERLLAAANDEGGVAMQNSIGKLLNCCQ
ncbi:eIF-2-alpha kinase activator GCN1 isoform X2 [Leptidea sinapis]|uniref:eIF-2-alpha kinase activator GCN1 isoform X2 n=1 Tax=Leptidea sinapis TaxID=189913 RepID=UPI0021C4B9C4|nr:eIF-2-alpha kinase activator GCN1 isoform X2 [Leptidea sinapis]